MVSEDLLMNEKTDMMKRLEELCRQNGRVMEVRSDGTIVTFDSYEGTDAQYFDDYASAIEWEKGYQWEEEEEHPVQEMR